MNFLYSFAAASALSLAAFSAFAQETVSISPAPGEYDVLPTQFVFTIDGPEKIAKNLIGGGNPGSVTMPDGTTQQITGVIEGNTVTCTVPAGTPTDMHGDYTVKLRGNSLNYTWPDGTKTKSVETSFIYTVEGVGEGPDEPEGVQYNIAMINTIPSLAPFDVKNKTLETLQLYFDRGGLVIDDAMKPLVTVKGPNYLRYGQLVPNMAAANVTIFKVALADPVYNGTYTLSIPEGVLGDAEWMEDHSKGHANAAVDLTFEVIGGQDPSTITTDLTFVPLCEPAISAKVSDLSHIVLTFDSYPYWADGTELEVKKQPDGNLNVKFPYGKAYPEHGEGNEVILTLSKDIRTKGRYFIEIPEGTFWNEAHEADPDGGALNVEMTLEWQYMPEMPDIQLISHVPATNARVGVFKMGEPCIIVNTTKNDLVTHMTVKVVEYPLDSEEASGTTIISGTTYRKDDEGASCWYNETGSDIVLSPDCYYECTVKLYQGSALVILEELFEFYGADTTGIIGIEATGSDGPVYTIQGLRVNRPVSDLPGGLYIKNGKKFVIR